MATPEASWRSGQALRPYVKDAQQLLIKARQTGSAKITQTRLDLLHLPIIDGSVTSDHALSRLADDCCQRILDGERLYIHCWGGHGRTGTLVAVVLARLYGLTTVEALTYTQALHDVRRYPQNVRSPQTQVQVEQVKRILAAERVGAKACEYRWPLQPIRPEAGPSTIGTIEPPQKNNTPQPFGSITNTTATNGKLVGGLPPAAAVPAVPAEALFIRPDSSLLTSSKAVAAAAALDPPVRTESLIPANFQPGAPGGGGGWLSASNTNGLLGSRGDAGALKSALQQV